MDVGKIYIVRNTVNDKVYIGQTICPIKERFGHHLSAAYTRTKSTRKFYNAIRKYGKDKFYVELIEDNIPIGKLDEKEIYYIEQYDSYNKGYNSTIGGDGAIIHSLKDKEDLINEFNNGVSFAQMAKDYNVNKVTIQRFFSSLGMKRNVIPSKQTLIELQDKTNKEIATIFNVDKYTITRWFRRYDIPRGIGCKNKNLPQNQRKDINNIEYIWYRLFHNGVSTAKKFSVSIKSVWQYDVDIWGERLKPWSNNTIEKVCILYKNHPKYYDMVMNFMNNGVTYREALREVLAVNGLSLPDEQKHKPQQLSLFDDNSFQ